MNMKHGKSIFCIQGEKNSNKKILKKRGKKLFEGFKYSFKITYLERLSLTFFTTIPYSYYC